MMRSLKSSLLKPLLNWTGSVFPLLPKGPFRTEDTTALTSVVVFCAAVVFSYYFCSGLLLDFPLKLWFFKVSAVVFYCGRSEFTTDSKFTIRSIFSTGGSFGWFLLGMSEKCWKLLRSSHNHSLSGVIAILQSSKIIGLGRAIHGPIPV